MADELTGKTIAFLVAQEGIEQVELTDPWKTVEEAGGHRLVRRDTSLERTRWQACRSSCSWLFSRTVRKLGRRAASAIASASL